MLTLLNSSASAAEPAVLPTGLHGGDRFSGIYAADTAAGCCWLGTDAVLHLVPPSDARALLVNVFIPPFALKRAPQRLSVRIAGREETTAPLGAGEHELVFSLPTASQGTRLEVEMKAAYTFVPAQIGLNRDPRHLSVLIRAVGFSTPASEESGAPLADTELIAPALDSLLLIAAGLWILMLTLRRPVYGLCALILTSPFALALYVHGTTITLPKVALVAVALGLIARLPGLPGAPVDRSYLILTGAFLAFIATMLLASLHAASHAAALRETLKFVQYLITLSVAYAAYRCDPGERLVRGALLLVAFVVIVPALCQERIGAQEWESIGSHTVARISGPLGGPNQLAGFLGIVLPPIGAFWMLRGRNAWEGLAVSLGAIACVLTFSRGGTVALAIALAFIAAAQAPPLARSMLPGTALVYIVASFLAFLVFAGSAPHAVAAAFGAAGSHAFNGGLGNRYDLWRGAYTMWHFHPLFGVGPGNYELAIGSYVPGLRTHANGMFFQTLAEQGALGLSAFLVLTAASVVVFARRFTTPLALGAAGASIALAFHQIVDCIVVYPKVGIMWCVLLGIAAAKDRASKNANNLNTNA